MVSLLNSTILDSIAKSALDAPKRSVPRAYVADPLAVFLTVSNLRGVPYGFELFGGDDKFVYGMLRHMDDMRFAVSRTGAKIDSRGRSIPPRRRATTGPSWRPPPSPAAHFRSACGRAP